MLVISQLTALQVWRTYEKCQQWHATDVHKKDTLRFCDTNETKMSCNKICKTHNYRGHND